MKQFLKFIPILVVGAVITGCQPKGNFPGRVYFPDMAYSPAYETFSSQNATLHRDLEDGITALDPVHGTIPRGFLMNDEDVRMDDNKMKSLLINEFFKDPRFYPEMNNEQYEKSSMFQNPMLKTKSNVAEGKRLYNIYCAVCHGENGAGDGSIIELRDKEGNKTGEEGPYTAIPPHYETRLPTITDGQMYYSVTYGKGMMGGYAAQVTPEERWKIIHYIKDLGGIGDPMSEELDFSNFEIKAGAAINVPNIYFDLGSANLQSKSYAVLNQVTGFLNSNADLKVEIGAHSDNRGNDVSNKTLSEARAQSVVNYLIEKGVNANQLMPHGYGEEMPAVDCGDGCTEAEHAQNRRTTITVLGSVHDTIEAHGDEHMNEEHHDDHHEVNDHH